MELAEARHPAASVLMTEIMTALHVTDVEFGALCERPNTDSLPLAQVAVYGACQKFRDSHSPSPSSRCDLYNQPSPLWDRGWDRTIHKPPRQEPYSTPHAAPGASTGHGITPEIPPGYLREHSVPCRKHLSVTITVATLPRSCRFLYSHICSFIINC